MLDGNEVIQRASVEHARAEIAYQHALRGLDSQVAVLTEIRVRANYFVVASVGVATLFAGFTLRDTSSSYLLLAALVPLGLLLMGLHAAIGVLRPTGKQGGEGELQLVASARALLSIEESSESAHRATAAEAMEDLWESNQVVVERFMARLRFAATCLVGQVASWIVPLILKQVF